MHAPSDAEQPEVDHSTGNSPGDAVKIAELMRAFNTGANPQVGFQGEYVFEDIPTQGSIRYDWLIRPKAAGLIVHGRLDGVLALDCARCLMPFTAPVSVLIEERYVFSRFTEDYGREKELQAEDFYETADEEGMLDLKDLARQFLLLETENHPLCGLKDCCFNAPAGNQNTAGDEPETHLLL